MNQKLYYQKQKNLYKNSKKNKKKILLFKANWCIHCKQFESTWNELKQFHEKIEPNIKFKMYDVDNPKDKKYFDKYHIESFPTILLLKNNNNSVEKYTGDRTIKNLKNFILSS